MPHYDSEHVPIVRLWIWAVDVDLRPFVENPESTYYAIAFELLMPDIETAHAQAVCKITRPPTGSTEDPNSLTFPHVIQGCGFMLTDSHSAGTIPRIGRW